MYDNVLSPPPPVPFGYMTTTFKQKERVPSVADSQNIHALVLSCIRRELPQTAPGSYLTKKEKRLEMLSFEAPLLLCPVVYPHKLFLSRRFLTFCLSKMHFRTFPTMTNYFPVYFSLYFSLTQAQGCLLILL